MANSGSGRLAVTAVCASIAFAAAAAAGPTPSPRPQLLSIRYGKFHPAGASHSYWALRIRARDSDASIVAIEVEQLSPQGAVAHMDGGCIGDPRDGRVATWYSPKYLPARHYRFRVTVTSASCRNTNAPPQERSFIRRLRVG